MERRILTMPSQTLALKAKRLLLREGIAVRIVRPSPHLTPRGCTVALETDAWQLSRVLHILEENQLPFGEILGM